MICQTHDHWYHFVRGVTQLLSRGNLPVGMAGTREMMIQPRLAGGGLLDRNTACPSRAPQLDACGFYLSDTGWQQLEPVEYACRTDTPRRLDITRFILALLDSRMLKPSGIYICHFVVIPVACTICTNPGHTCRLRADHPTW